MIKAVLFDLDGTLLPMDLDVFIKRYLRSVCLAMHSHGYEADSLARAILKGTDAMVHNDGQRTNEQAFWDTFASIYGEEARKDEALFARYYEERFDEIKDVASPAEGSLQLVKDVKALGLRTILATNPVFPPVATEHRLAWAGLSPEEFELYTTYENSSYCKPNPLYYEEILQRIGLRGEECLMVGNDAIEDVAAEKVGMKVFLLTPYLINRDGRDITSYPSGDFGDLLSYVRSLL